MASIMMTKMPSKVASQTVSKMGSEVARELALSQVKWETRIPAKWQIK